MSTDPGGSIPTTYFVAWWNVENLFDYENSPRRTEKLRRAIGSDLNGWTPALRDRKIDQLASVIVRMNNGLGPDIPGGVRGRERLGVATTRQPDVFTPLRYGESRSKPSLQYVPRRTPT